MSDREESLQQQLAQARKEVQDAHRVIALLVKKAGGKVSIGRDELISQPAKEEIITYEDPATMALIVKVGGVDG
jgi:cellobiose-specific phosphotransferase system component IIA